MEVLKNIAAKKTLPISVVVPCYNCANTIERAVQSVLLQTCLPLEILLVEDKSTAQKAVVAAINKVLSNNNTTVLIKVHYLEKNSGPATARNMGWEMATGDYIAFLDADDYWLPNKLALQWDIISQHPQLSILGSHLKSNKGQHTPPKAIRPFNLLWKNPYFTSTVIVKKELPFRFPSNGYYSEDFYLWAQIINHKAYTAFLMRQKLAANQSNQKGLSANHLKMLKGELKVLRYTCKESYNFLVFIAASGWSILKLLRRLIVT